MQTDQLDWIISTFCCSYSFGRRSVCIYVANMWMQFDRIIKWSIESSIFRMTKAMQWLALISTYIESKSNSIRIAIKLCLKSRCVRQLHTDSYKYLIFMDFAATFRMQDRPVHVSTALCLTVFLVFDFTRAKASIVLFVLFFSWIKNTRILMKNTRIYNSHQDCNRIYRILNDAIQLTW